MHVRKVSISIQQQQQPVMDEWTEYHIAIHIYVLHMEENPLFGQMVSTG